MVFTLWTHYVLIVSLVNIIFYFQNVQWRILLICFYCLLIWLLFFSCLQSLCMLVAMQPGPQKSSAGANYDNCHYVHLLSCLLLCE
jgi:hypothetical protein